MAKIFKDYSFSVLRAIWRCHIQPARSYKKFSKAASSLVIPQNVSPVLPVPDTIQKPPYISNPDIHTQINFEGIEIKTDHQIEGLRKACKLARKILDYTASKLEVGMTTDDIDVIVHNKCIENCCYPSPLLYKGFPKSVCTSVNNVACHGIPDDRKLLNGDIINIDITVYLNGYHGDLSETYVIGETDKSGYHLVNAARSCRDAGIKACKLGAKYTDIGKSISDEALKHDVAVIPRFCGHGIGDYFHGLPCIIHVENDYDEDLIMEAGVSFTVEPVISEGSYEVEILNDGWTAVTIDGSRTAQFEHTVLITDTGVDILTLP